MVAKPKKRDKRTEKKVLSPTHPFQVGTHLICREAVKDALVRYERVYPSSSKGPRLRHAVYASVVDEICVWSSPLKQHFSQARRRRDTV
jgi:hypothetical protein